MHLSCQWEQNTHASCRSGEKRRERERLTCGPIYEGYIRPFSQKPCVSGVGGRTHAKQNVYSINSIVELLHNGVGRAELQKNRVDQSQTDPKDDNDARCELLINFIVGDKNMAMHHLTTRFNRIARSCRPHALGERQD
jgi:hypothetical protein